MPKRKFVFSKEAGKVVEITSDEVKPLCEEIHKDVESRHGDLFSGSVKQHRGDCWNYTSEAMAVNPRDIKRAQAILAKHGVRTEYDKLGRPIMRDRAHRKAHMRALGFYDRDAGYGDAEPLHFKSEYASEAYQQQAIMQQLASGQIF